MAKIAILGFGTVGSGIAEVLDLNQEDIRRRTGQPAELKYILVRREFPGSPYCDRMVQDFSVIENDPEVKVVAECIGGCGAALDLTTRALKAGKHVVTANKALVASHGLELLNLAREHNCNFLFEASVGGGIPIIRPISQCLAANEVSEIAGILNGTTNFILTKMIREHMAFEEALKLAQELGYAERDPSADVEGADACRKICILASLAFGTHVYPEDVHTEGITKVTPQDVAYADAWGGVIKLIGQVSMLENGRIAIMVAPMLISRESQLANVDDVFNGIVVRGDATGDVMFYGKGAGKLPTASAVVADVIDCVKHLKARKYLFWEDAKPDYIEPFENIKGDFFLRVQGDCSSDEAFAKAAEALPGAARIVRREEAPGEAGVTVKNISEAGITECLKRLEQSGVRVLDRLRISDF